MEVSATEWDCGSVPTSGHLLTCGMASLVLSALLGSQKNPEFYIQISGFDGGKKCVCSKGADSLVCGERWSQPSGVWSE